MNAQFTLRSSRGVQKQKGKRAERFARVCAYRATHTTVEAHQGTQELRWQTPQVRLCFCVGDNAMRVNSLRGIAMDGCGREEEERRGKGGEIRERDGCRNVLVSPASVTNHAESDDGPFPSTVSNREWIGSQPTQASVKLGDLWRDRFSQ